MELLIVRHAPAGSREEFAETGQSDDVRPLTKTGVRDMQDVARGLRGILPTIDSVVTSPLVRARQTADIVAEAYDVQVVESDALRPEAEFGSFVNWVRRKSTDDVIAAVGHEPHLSGLVAYLIGDSGDAAIDLKKGGAAFLEFDGPPARGKGRLRWLITPKIATNKERD
jgi:phosphohistidine phosphatase